MTAILAVPDSGNAWMGLVPAAAVVVALIVNTASMGKRDTNYKCAFATNILFTALLVENAAWTVEIFGGGTAAGIFWAIVSCAGLHVAAACVAAWGLWEVRTRGTWAHGRQRATWGFWINVAMLAVLFGWFYLRANKELHDRIFG